MTTILQEQRTSHEVLRWSAALLTAAAAAIHFAVIPEHFDEDWAFGVFFAASAWAQVLWALLVVRSDAHRSLVAGIAGNLTIAIVWAASRTTGVPFGPDPGSREAVDLIDLLATTLEILAVGAVATLLRSRIRVISHRTVAALLVAVAVIVVPLTTAAIATGAGSEHDTSENGRMHGQP